MSTGKSPENDNWWYCKHSRGGHNELVLLQVFALREGVSASRFVGCKPNDGRMIVVFVIDNSPSMGLPVSGDSSLSRLVRGPILFSTINKQKTIVLTSMFALPYFCVLSSGFGKNGC